MKLSKVFGIVLSLHVGVILLVMFQPSCQTTSGPAKLPDSEAETEANEESFNQAVEESKESVLNPATDGSSDGFAPPQRPAPGEIIVPQESKVAQDPVPSIIIPTEQTPGAIDLKPADLAIYKVVRGDTLWGIARKNGVSLANLLKANPNMDKSGRLAIGQEIMIPRGSEPIAPSFSGEVSVDQPGPSVQGNSYQVEKGDTLSGIARKHNLRLSELLKANGISMSSIIRPGQILTIPGGSGGQSSVNEQSVEVVPQIVPPGASTHVVKKGENLSRISSIYGVTVAQIMEWNGLSNPSLIKAGQPLIISQGIGNNAESTVSPALNDDPEVVAPDDKGTLQDFFNDPSAEDRPIIDAP